MKCMGAFQMMSSSYGKDTQVDLDEASVGDCFENALIANKSCKEEIEPALAESLDGVKVPSEEELKKAKKEVKK